MQNYDAFFARTETDSTVCVHLVPIRSVHYIDANNNCWCRPDKKDRYDSVTGQRVVTYIHQAYTPKGENGNGF